MPQNFIAVDREQSFLMPPSLLDWVAADHFVWTILSSVEEMDLSPFLGAYRPDGHGRPAYDPSMMVALLLYAYAKGNRSSRGIEQECREDVAYRVICANLVPDHSTIAEFRKRHEAALADLFTSVLSLCKQAGLVKVGVIAIDGTKIAANASLDANQGYERIVREILDEAAETDRVEDELYGDARGDELPEQMHTPEGRRAALREAKLKLDGKREASGEAREESGDGDPAVVLDLDRERISSSEQGRRGWSRDARRQLDERRKSEARPIPRSRTDRLKEAARRLEEEHAAECEANAAYEAYRARGVMKDGRRFGAPPKPYEPPETPAGRINTTDHDSRIVRTRVSRPGRATTRRPRSVKTRSSSRPRSQSTRPTSVTSSRWSRQLLRSWASLEPIHPRLSSPTPATGTRGRWRTSSVAASRC